MDIVSVGENEFSFMYSQLGSSVINFLYLHGTFLTINEPISIYCY